MQTLKSKNNYQEVLKRALEILQKGGLVVFPTDTVYGLLADSTNKGAISKLIEFKNRPAGKAISVFVSNFKMLTQYTLPSDSQLATLKRIIPGPFTVILKSNHKVDYRLESENGTLGVRIPDYALIIDLVKEFGKPLTATSANLSGNSPNYSASSLLSKLSLKKKRLIDLLIDAGQLPKNKPSTIVDLTESRVKILRKGDAGFLNSSKSFISKSADETKNIASKIEIQKSNKPLVFIIEGELGVGKTVFVKGLASKLGIDNIVSPTYVVYYEYGNFFHYDLYNVTEKTELNYLGIEKNLKPGNILCFEWGEKTGDIISLLKSKAKIIYVSMKYINEKEREITINS